MYRLLLTIEGGVYEEEDNCTYEQLIDFLGKYDTSWELPKAGKKKSARCVALGEENCYAHVTFSTKESRIKWDEFVAKVEANDGDLLRNPDDMGKGPVYLIETGTRITGWDHQWDPEKRLT